ncbi:copper transporter 1 [Jatropha curcas]|uniref:copper transporter 1 n=1 Tax=Jatropha curcas TaxID=180498 RepID=UPI0005FC1AEE|nr:copper transporter 1 [Jatropha curcas]
MEKPMDPQMSSDGSMNMSPSMETVMHMSFYWGKDAIILFSEWPNHSLGMYILSFFFIFFLAVAIEVLSASPTAKLCTNPVITALIQAGVYAVRMGFAYMVMLAVMSYNLGIFIAAVAGHGVGFFLVKARGRANANQADLDGQDPVPKV